MGQRWCLNFSQLIKDKKIQGAQGSSCRVRKSTSTCRRQERYRIKDGEQTRRQPGKEGECRGCCRGVRGGIVKWQFTAEGTEASTQRTTFMWLKKKRKPRIFYPLKPIF